MDTPESSIASFGTSLVGSDFTWKYLDPDTEQLREFKGRATASLMFHDILRYTTARSISGVHAAKASEETRIALTALDVASPTFQEDMERVLQDRIVEEDRRWAASVDAILLLVAEPYREELRPLLINGDVKQVQALRVHLEEQVIGQTEQDVRTASRVDPTLLPPPPISPSNPDSGPGSDSEASTSTT